MANLAPARAADAAGFADGEVGEVVVEDEFFFAGAAGVGVEFLGILAGAEGAERDGLGFAALEERRPMSAREQADFAVDRADGLEVAAVQALALVHDQAADSFLLDVVEGVIKHKFRYFLGAEFLDEFLTDLVFDGGDCGFAGQFAWGEQRRDNAVAGQGLGFVEDFVRDDVEGNLAFGSAGLGGQFILRGDHRAGSLRGQT